MKHPTCRLFHRLTVCLSVQCPISELMIDHQLKIEFWQWTELAMTKQKPLSRNKKVTEEEKRTKEKKEKWEERKKEEGTRGGYDTADFEESSEATYLPL